MNYKYLLDEIIDYNNEESDCKLHEGTFLAYNENTGDMQCNQCIFEGNADSIQFLIALGNEMKAEFEDKFKQYKASLSKMTEVSVDTISKTLENTIYTKFKTIQDEIYKIENQVLSSISQNVTLNNLECLIRDLCKQSLNSKPPHQPSIANAKYLLLQVPKSLKDIIPQLKEKDGTEANLNNLLSQNSENEAITNKINELIDEVIKEHSPTPFELHGELIKEIEEIMKVRNNKLGNIENSQSGKIFAAFQPLSQLSNPSLLPELNVNDPLPSIQKLIQPSSMIKESLSCQKSATNISSQSTLNRRESKENRKITNEIYNYDELNEFDDCIIEKENLNHIIEKEVKLFDSQEIESCSQPKDFNSHAMILNSQLKDENSQPKLLNSQTKEDKSEIKEKNNMFGEYKDIFEEYNLMYTTEKGKLYQVDFSGKRKHILNYPDLYMSKCIYLPNGGLYVIGGSNTKDLETATNKVIKFDMPDLTPVVQKPMISKRSSFGCTLSKDKKAIFVVGGYSKSYHTFDKCEIYNIRNNLKLLNILNALYLNNLKSTVWISLPSLHECLANTSLCQFTSMANKREYLYCFGGIFCQIVEKEEKTCLSKSIERLDLTSLNTINPEWEMLKVKLNYSACDIGSFQISENRILIYGGWDGDSISTVSEYNPDTHDEISEIDTKLDTSDFFLTNGIVSRSVSKQDSNIFMFRFLGQKSLHEVDTLSYVFNSFSIDN